jgi:hypothetical protein
MLSVFSEMTSCSPLKINRLFEEINHFHFQGRRISQRRKELITCYLPHTCSLLGFFFRSWIWRPQIPLKIRLNFNGLYGFISLKIEFFIITTVRTQNSASFRYTILNIGYFESSVSRNLSHLQTRCINVLMAEKLFYIYTL